MLDTCSFCRHFVFLAFLPLAFLLAIAQDFTWMEVPKYIEQSVLNYHPGPRGSSSFWSDSKGNLWMFGGRTYWDHISQHPVFLNDLWRYDVLESSWKIIHGGGVYNSSDPFLRKAPSPRSEAIACGVSDLIFVVYGGINEKGDTLNDTWLFYISKKRWFQLGFTNDQQELIQPPARQDTTLWCLEDRMIIFGGIDQSYLLSDMWSFSLQNLSWSLKAPQLPLVASAHFNQTYPQARSGAVSWVGMDGVLYMFGGNVQSPLTHRKTKNIGYTSDLWQYSLKNSTWSFITGCQDPCVREVPDDSSNCCIDVKYVPNCRGESASWVDTSGNLWLFGGDGDTNAAKQEFLADLWVFRIKNKTWEEMISNNKSKNEMKSEKHGGSYYFRDMPSARCESSFWIVKNHLFIFGGIGYNQNHNISFLADLWLLCVDYSQPSSLVFSPSMIFLFCLSGISGVLVLFCIGTSVRKCQDFPRLKPLRNGKKYKVKYSPLTETATFES